MENTVDIQQLQQNINALASLTGVALHIYSENKSPSDLFPCAFCRKMQPEKQNPSACHALIYDLLPYGQSKSESGIFFCPAGFCHILTATDLPHSFLLSDVIVCSEPNDTVIKKVWTNLFDSPYDINQVSHQSSVSFLEPKNIVNLSRLIHVISHRDSASQFNDKLIKCLQELPTCSRTDIEKLSDRMLENILSKAGLNMNLAGFLCTNILFSFIDSLDIDVSREVSRCLFVPQFMQASSISELKQAFTKSLQFIAQCTAQNVQIRQHAVVQQALQFIHTHYREDITQVAVSKAVYLSSSYFSKVFKEVTGSGFNQYVNEFRIQKAKKLLANPSINLNTIHTLVGFHHQTYFSKIFHRLTGMSPGKYRSFLLP